MHVGIMQGRLLPPEGDRIQAFPRARWGEEFELAAEAGLSAIEWIYDVHGEGANPIETDAGIARVHALSRESGVGVRSVCADWFMEHPLLRLRDEAARAAWGARLAWLVERCTRLGATRIVVPFVDQATILGDADVDTVVRTLEGVLPTLEAGAVELHLETALGPAEFAALLARVPHPLVRVNYDSGNSAAQRFASAQEFAAYGGRIGSVHVKDRVPGGGTVPLGAGGADLPVVITGLRALGYDGDIVLQVARGSTGDEVAWARTNRETVERLWRGVAMAGPARA